jgi:hypothetical protein
VQLRWVAPTDTFIELGGEVLRGQDFPSGGAAHAGAGVKTLFAHFGGDVGGESSWLAGVSALDSHTEEGEDGFSGHERLYIADGTWKWAPDGNTKDGGITLRGEYFLEHRDGDYSIPRPLDTRPGTARAAAPTSRACGASIASGTPAIATTACGPTTKALRQRLRSRQHSVMLTWRNSEFSLLRLQLSRERANRDDTDTRVAAVPDCPRRARRAQILRTRP